MLASIILLSTAFVTRRSKYCKEKDCKTKLNHNILPNKLFVATVVLVKWNLVKPMPLCPERALICFAFHLSIEYAAWMDSLIQHSIIQQYG